VEVAPLSRFSLQTIRAPALLLGFGGFTADQIRAAAGLLAHVDIDAPASPQESVSWVPDVPKRRCNSGGVVYRSWPTQSRRSSSTPIDLKYR